MMREPSMMTPSMEKETIARTLSFVTMTSYGFLTQLNLRVLSKVMGLISARDTWFSVVMFDTGAVVLTISPFSGYMMTMLSYSNVLSFWIIFCSYGSELQRY